MRNSLSHTTRKPRAKEKDGVDYNFTTVEAIKKDIADNKFIEVSQSLLDYIEREEMRINSVLYCCVVACGSARQLLRHQRRRR